MAHTPIVLNVNTSTLKQWSFQEPDSWRTVDDRLVHRSTGLAITSLTTESGGLSNFISIGLALTCFITNLTNNNLFLTS